MRSSLKARSLAATLLLLTVAGLAAAAGGKFAGDGFAVAFPGQPERVTKRHSFDGMELNMTSYGLDRGGMSFFVSAVGDFPAFVMQRPEVDEVFFLQLEQNLILSAKAAGRSDLTVASRSNLARGGRQFVFDSPRDMGVLRAYKSGRRFYAVGVFGPKESYDARRAVDFLESFSLTGK